MIAWDLDAAGMLELHRYYWDATDRSREDIDTADFRVPTQGDLWDFDCLFGSVATRGEVVSYPFLSEMPGVFQAPVLTVRCDAPEPALASTPSSVRLARSVRASEMPPIQLEVPLQEHRRKPVSTALCNAQVWGSELLRERSPGIVEFWFLYYSEHLGIDEIYLYDLDGSFEQIPLVQELRAGGRVIYEPGFASIPPLKDLFNIAGYKTSTVHMAQTLVQHHCWQQARQNAAWVHVSEPAETAVLPWALLPPS